MPGCRPENRVAFALAHGRKDDERRAAYRALFRNELDATTLDDIRLALNQGQPLGDARFTEQICTMAGVHRAHARPGRSAGSGENGGLDGDQGDFGF